MKLSEMINKVICGEAEQVLKGVDLKEVALILTDPPYPDYHAELYGYKDGIIDFLKDIPIKQLIFWSAKVDFPLDYTAIHIWDKKTGVGSMYERIFERNGGLAYKVFNSYLINSTVAANYGNDTFTGHPSQKPIKLMEKLILENSEPNDIILDPFCGSGSTCKAAKNTGRRYIGIEKDPKWIKITEDRLKQGVLNF